MKLSNPFKDPNHNVYIIEQRSDFTQLISIINQDAFSKKLIRIEYRSELNDEDFKSLIDTLKSKPKAVAAFKRLVILSAFITQLPDMSAFHNLNMLHLDYCGFTSVPNLEYLPNLKYFHFSPGHKITCAAPSHLNNKKLESLTLCNLNLTSTLDLSNNNALKELELVDCGLQDVSFIEHCINLTELDLHKNEIKVPPKLNMHKKLTELYLNENQMTEPPEVYECPLTILNLSYNQLRCAPKELPVSLKSFYIRNNLLEVPPKLTNCRSLTSFSAENNRLLNASDISNCGKLGNYSFRGNPLTLASKIHLMQFDLKRPRIAYSFDLPDQCGEDLAYDPDFIFLAQAFNSLPKEVRTKLRAENNFSHYEYHNYMLLMTILKAIKPLASHEENISRRILGFLGPPPALLDHIVSIIKDAFSGNQRALEIIDCYTKRVKESDNEIAKQITESRFNTAIEHALLQFKSLQQHKTSNLADNERHNRITARHCVIS